MVMEAISEDDSLVEVSEKFAVGMFGLLASEQFDGFSVIVPGN